MPDKKILVYVPPERMLWIEPILADAPNLEICHSKDDAVSTQDRAKVVVDILQANSQVSVAEVVDYSKHFDRIILINCETPIDIVDLLKAMDFPQVYFLTTGKVNWTPIHMTVVPHENFFGAVQRLYKDEDYRSLNLDPYSIKPYFFDALLGNYKLSRKYVYQSILDRGLNHQHIYVKYFKQNKRSLDEIIHEGSFDWPTGAQVITETNADYWTTSNMVMFKGKGTASSCIVPEKIYRDCAYSIVTESRIAADHVFLTEKTAKCLIARRLFVMFAGPGYLRHLQHLGFRTFGHIIDESYDLEPDHSTRWSRAFDQVERLIAMSQNEVFDQCRDVLEHNYRLFVSRDWETEFHNDITRLVTSR